MTKAMRCPGRGNSIEGDQRERGEYCDPELHTNLPVLVRSDAHRQSESMMPAKAVGLDNRPGWSR